MIHVVIHFDVLFLVAVLLLACFMNKDCAGLLVLVGYFASAVKYQVVLDDGTVVVETPEGGVEFHVKDGNNVELCSFFDGI